MRALLIDAALRTIIEFDHLDDHHNLIEILGGKNQNDFALGSGPLNTPRDPDDEDDYPNEHSADFLYVRCAFEQRLANDRAFANGKAPALKAWEGIEGDPRYWFQIDADRDPPTTFPIPGRGLVIGFTLDFQWCDAQISLEELTARVSFTRRRLRGTTTRTGIMPGEIWRGPVAPIVEER